MYIRVYEEDGFNYIKKMRPRIDPWTGKDITEQFIQENQDESFFNGPDDNYLERANNGVFSCTRDAFRFWDHQINISNRMDVYIKILEDALTKYNLKDLQDIVKSSSLLSAYFINRDQNTIDALINGILSACDCVSCDDFDPDPLDVLIKIDEIYHNEILIERLGNLKIANSNA